MSSLTPVLTFSRSPTFPPFLPLPLFALPAPLPPFGLFASAIELLTHLTIEAVSCLEPAIQRINDSIVLYTGQERSRIIEVGRLAFGPGIKLRCVDQNLPVWREFDVGAIHGPRRGSFEIDSFAVVPASVARTLEFVFAWLPIRRAPKMRAARVNHKQPVGRAVHPNSVLLLKFRINPEGKFRGISDLENAIRLEQCAGKKESKKGKEPSCEKAGDHYPHETAAAAIDFGGRNSGCDAGCGCRLRSSDRRRADIFCGIHRRLGCGLCRFGIRIDRFGPRHTSLPCGLNPNRRPPRTAAPPLASLGCERVQERLRSLSASHTTSARALINFRESFKPALISNWVKPRCIVSSRAS